MSGGDTRSARWKRSLAKWRRWQVEMTAAGYEVREPPDMEIPPHKRSGAD